MNNIQIGQEVQVRFDRLGQEPMVFTSIVMDIVDNNREQGVWVDHPECRGEDMMFVSLANPNINSVEAVAEIEVSTNQEMKEIKAELLKAIKWLDDVSIAVKVYDCYENTISMDGSRDQTYDVEINYYVDGEYQDGFYNQTFVGRFMDDEEAEKMAVRRAKAVLRTVKGWFKNNDDVVVEDGVEVYHA